MRIPTETGTMGIAGILIAEDNLVNMAAAKRSSEMGH
jgi:hypothetical protein